MTVCCYCRARGCRQRPAGLYTNANHSQHCGYGNRTMFVCLCNAIRERELREAIRLGVRTAEEAYRFLGVEMNCADCGDELQRAIDEMLAPEPAARRRVRRGHAPNGVRP